MATAIETMRSRVHNDAKTIGMEQPAKGLDGLLRIGESPSVEAFARQREFILKSINNRASSVSSLAEEIMRIERPGVLAEGKHESANEMKKRERFDSYLMGMSSANVKLFVDLNAYKNFLVDARNGMAKQFPDADNASRIEMERQIDELAKELGRAAKSANKTMRELAENKERDLYRMPMSERDVKSLKKNISEITDDSGNSISARLGANLVRFENAVPSKSVQERMVNDEIEIAERLPKQDREFLNRLAVVGGSMLSMDIIKELSVIGVQLDAYSSQQAAQAKSTARHGVRAGLETVAVTGRQADDMFTDPVNDKEYDTVRLSPLEVNDIMTSNAETDRKSDDAVRMSPEEMQNVMKNGMKTMHRDNENAVEAQLGSMMPPVLKPYEAKAAKNRIDMGDVITPEEIIRNAEQRMGSISASADRAAETVHAPVVNPAVNYEDEIIFEPLVFGLNEEELKRLGLYNAARKRIR